MELWRKHIKKTSVSVKVRLVAMERLRVECSTEASVPLNEKK